MSHSDPRASDRRESAQDLPGEDQPVSSSAERPATRPSRFKGPIVLRGREAQRRFFADDVFPRTARVRSTDEVLAALDRAVPPSTGADP